MNLQELMQPSVCGSRSVLRSQFAMPGLSPELPVRAVLIGCNYPGTSAKLDGCVNDVFALRSLLIKFFHFEKDEILLLIDDYPPPGETASSKLPTGEPTSESICPTCC